MTTAALSKRIVSAVEDIYKAGIPRHAAIATEQLATKMAKVIVDAAAKADTSFKASKTFSFTNSFGEEFRLSVDPSGKMGALAGDETDWQSLAIKDDALQDDFMFGHDELKWLRKTWKSATGRDLKHPSMTAEEQLVQAGFLHKCNSAADSPSKGAKTSAPKRSSKKK